MNELTRAEVDLSAITDNIKAIRARVGRGVKIMPAVKANAYGHGAIQVSRACLDAGADVLCVARVEEGIELREAGIDAPILILGCCAPEAAGEIVRHDMVSAVCDSDFARALSDAALAQKKKASAHVKIDTGMGRIGAPAERAMDLTRLLLTLPGLTVDGLFTHFPSSDEPDRSFTVAQIAALEKIIAGLDRHGIRIPIVHASNSGGILAFPEADFDAVRPGITIYGHYPSPEVPKAIAIREALTLRTRIVFLKQAGPGATISYGRTHTLKRESMVATLPVGYADGYSRLLSNQGEAAVRGRRVPVIGRVCMDQIMIDVTDVRDVKVGDEVVLYGGGCDYLSVSILAEKIGTIPYEVLCNISPRVPRTYVTG